MRLIRLIAPLMVLLGGAWLLVGCGGGDSTPSGPRVQVTALFSGTTVTVYSNALSWSPDGQWIAFEGGIGASPFEVFRVRAQAGATPVRVTKYEALGSEGGGETPNFLTSGNLAYYTGWIGDDKNMHILSAGPTQVENSPAPGILRLFNGSDVGLAVNSAASPERMSLSGDGSKAVISYNTKAYALTWSGAALTSVLLPDAMDAAVSPDGTYLAYRKADGNIVWRLFIGGAETVVGTGFDPSWSQENKLGYVNGSNYRVYNPATLTVKSYAAPPTTTLQHATLSWDGTAIAYRTFGGPNTGIAIGQLID